MIRRLSGWIFVAFALIAAPAGAQNALHDFGQERIGISASQQRAVENLFAEAGKARNAGHARLFELFGQLHTLYASYDLDMGRVTAARSEILALQQKMLAGHLDTEVRLRRILNREQFERLRAMMRAEHESHRRDEHGGQRPPRGEHP